MGLLELWIAGIVLENEKQDGVSGMGSSSANQDTEISSCNCNEKLLLSLQVLVLLGMDSAQEYKIAVLAGHLCFF